ncbi:hypothetical protein [Pseudomonas sp. FEN]|uniref:IS66 family transposase n=1 Tax=Pseudomonas sp. FEN TaxID=2767468 RepID=UPI00398FCA8F
MLKRHRFAKRAESFSPLQASLLEELVDADLAGIEAELKALKPTPTAPEARLHARCV